LFVTSYYNGKVLRFNGETGTYVGSFDMPSGFLPGGIAAQEVPEPSTFVLLGIGAMGLLAYAWRRRANLILGK
jgi:hypothetical protein